MTEINESNVIDLLEQAITEFGPNGMNSTYRDRVYSVYTDENKADIVAGDCYYITPGDPINVDDEGDIDWAPMDPQPLCLVGCVFQKVDLSWRAIEAANAEAIDENLAATLANDSGLQITPGALAALYAAQRTQDSAKTWGEALQAARIALNSEAAHA